MKKLIAFPVILFGLFSFIQNPETKPTPPKSFYDLSVKSIDGKKDIRFKEFQGKKVLLVNTATQCGYTKQYGGLSTLYERYKDQLVIVAFPCNEFGEQEPGDQEQIETFCRRKYDVTFPIAEKIHVKPGENQHQVYQWLTQKKYNKKKDVNVRWNFGKFLISESGKLIEYFPSNIAPLDSAIVANIEKK